MVDPVVKYDSFNQDAISDYERGMDGEIDEIQSL